MIELQPNAIAWLNLGGDLPLKNWFDRLQQVRSMAGLLENWPQDVMRHSFCSYSLPVFGASKTAEWAGHSEDMLFKTYRRKVSPSDAKAFWEIFP